jgi:predicted transposase YbfD/YdcC
LDLTESIVTLDSMGCQTKIVERIVQKGADYVIGLKGNQGTLNRDVRLFFESKPSSAQFETDVAVDKGHGRLETRKCTITADIDWLQEQHPQWKNLNSVIEIESQRETKEGITMEK